jgi:TonB family protein
MVLEPALRIRAVLHPNGRLSGIEPTTPLSVMPGLDRVLADALAKVGEGHALTGLLGELRTFAGSPSVSDEDRTADADSLLLSLGVGVAPDTLFGSLPLLEVRLPVYDSAALPVSLPQNPTPTYPHGARFRGERGEVLVQFVVTPDGRVDDSTLRVLGATSRDFARAVEAVLPRYRFMPAEANGCAVPMAVQMPFKFDVAR